MNGNPLRPGGRRRAEPQWCIGLPYTLEAVQEAIPEAARPFVTVEWNPQDDLLPECAPDPTCVHHPANIGRWL